MCACVCTHTHTNSLSLSHARAHTQTHTHRRSTDQSYVVDEEKHLVDIFFFFLKRHCPSAYSEFSEHVDQVELNARKGEIKHIRREKGVEQQCRLMCEDCGCLLAYRPKPVG